jgi:hypothetical protein
MGRPRKLPPTKRTIARVLKAIEEARGFKTFAADRLKVKYDTLQRFLVEQKDIFEPILEYWREKRIDRAELKLDVAIENGEPWAIGMTLKAARSRQYGDRLTLEGDEAKPLTVRTFDYGSAIAKIATRSERDPARPGEDQDGRNGETVGKNSHGGSDVDRLRE